MKSIIFSPLTAIASRSFGSQTNQPQYTASATLKNRCLAGTDANGDSVCNDIEAQPKSRPLDKPQVFLAALKVTPAASALFGAFYRSTPIKQGTERMQAKGCLSNFFSNDDSSSVRTVLNESCHNPSFKKQATSVTSCASPIEV
jgi:hypothetical protein